MSNQKSPTDEQLSVLMPGDRIITEVGMNFTVFGEWEIIRVIDGAVEARFSRARENGKTTVSPGEIKMIAKSDIVSIKGPNDPG